MTTSQEQAETINGQGLFGSTQVAEDNQLLKSDDPSKSKKLAEAAEEKQKRQLKEMKREEYRFYKVKMLATIGITIVTYIVFFCLIKYLPGDGDASD